MVITKENPVLFPCNQLNIAHTNAMHVHRLHGRNANNRVLRKGAVWRGQTCIIRYLFGHPFNVVTSPTTPAVVYMGSYAPLALHKHAVKRNRMRRRCREALHAQMVQQQKIPTVQLLLCPKISSLESDYRLIQTDMSRFYEFICSQLHA